MSELIDNRAHRIREMKRIIRGLHDGEDIAAVRERFKAIVRHADAGEVAAMEQELLAEGLPVQELMKTCDLHSEVVSDLLVERPHAEIQPGHPVDVFRRENLALADQAEALRLALASVVDRDDEDLVVTDQELVPARRAFNALMDVEKHYARKENLLFPILERYGITGPSTVMWGKDDEVRQLLRDLGEALHVEGATVAEWRIVLEAVVEPALAALVEMIRKEEKILLPLSLQTLNEAEWGEIWSQSPEIGWCLVDPDGAYAPPEPVGPAIPSQVSEAAEREGIALHTSVATRTSQGGALVFPTGSLDLAQLKGIFSVLPVDLTFVDADDRVRFFTEGADRVFVRPKAIIGRRVEHCHPPSSVHVVEQILSDFRSGRQDVAEFWIEHHERFVHIRYFAVRDEDGGYQGTLEVTQDLTHQRNLEGERRLLAYD